MGELMRRDEKKREKREEIPKPPVAGWGEYREVTEIHLFGWVIWHRVRRGFPEWEVRKPVGMTGFESLEPRHLPETGKEVRKATTLRPGVKSIELSIRHAMRLICDEAITEQHFKRARINADGVHFDNVSIVGSLGEAPLVVNIVVLRPSAFIRDETALSQPPTALAA